MFTTGTANGGARHSLRRFGRFAALRVGIPGPAWRALIGRSVVAGACDWFGGLHVSDDGVHVRHHGVQLVGILRRDHRDRRIDGRRAIRRPGTPARPLRIEVQSFEGPQPRGGVVLQPHLPVVPRWRRLGQSLAATCAATRARPQPLGQSRAATGAGSADGASGGAIHAILKAVHLQVSVPLGGVPRRPPQGRPRLRHADGRAEAAARLVADRTAGAEAVARLVGLVSDLKRFIHLSGGSRGIDGAGGVRGSQAGAA
eukprot:1179192-Prorocentrum_minimum.AAC.1